MPTLLSMHLLVGSKTARCHVLLWRVWARPAILTHLRKAATARLAWRRAVAACALGAANSAFPAAACGSPGRPTARRQSPSFDNRPPVAARLAQQPAPWTPGTSSSTTAARRRCPTRRRGQPLPLPLPPLPPPPVCRTTACPFFPAQFGESGDIEGGNKKFYAALCAEFLGMMLFALYGGEARDSAAGEWGGRWTGKGGAAGWAGRRPSMR